MKFPGTAVPFWKPPRGGSRLQASRWALWKGHGMRGQEGSRKSKTGHRPRPHPPHLHFHPETHTSAPAESLFPRPGIILYILNTPKVSVLQTWLLIQNTRRPLSNTSAESSSHLNQNLRGGEAGGVNTFKNPSGDSTLQPTENLCWKQKISFVPKWQLLSLLASVKKCKSLSHVWVFADPWTAAHQNTMEFFRQEYWRTPSPGNLPDPGSTQVSCIGRWDIYHWATWEVPLQGMARANRMCFRVHAVPQKSSRGLLYVIPVSWAGGRGRVLKERAQLCCLWLQTTVPGAASLHMVPDCHLESQSWLHRLYTQPSQLRCWQSYFTPWSLVSRARWEASAEAPCEQVKLNSAQRER